MASFGDNEKVRGETVNNEDLAKMISLCVAKMSLLESELEQMQILLVNMFVPREKQTKARETIEENFEKCRNAFEEAIKNIQNDKE